MRDIQYSTKPMTVAEAIFAKKGEAGDMEAIAQLVLSRTDLTIDEVLRMDLVDLMPIVQQVVKALQRANVLGELGKQLGDMAQGEGE